VLLIITGRTFLYGAGLSLLLGLPFGLQRGGLAWYVPAVACLALWIELLPHLWKRPVQDEPQPQPAPPPPAPAPSP
jgi:hypothetical protein